MPDVELWESTHGVLALRRRHADTGWIGVEANRDEDGQPTHFGRDAMILGDFRSGYMAPGFKTEHQRRREETLARWAESGVVEMPWPAFRPAGGEGPRLVATWNAGRAHIIGPEDHVLYGSEPGPAALRYMSPNGHELPDDLLRLDRGFQSGAAAKVIGLSPRTMRLLATPANGDEPYILRWSRGGRAGRQIVFTARSVYEYAASVRKRGLGGRQLRQRSV